MKLEEFIRRKNIDHFRNLLGKTTDEAERKILLGLLAQEEAGHSSFLGRGKRPWLTNILTDSRP